MKPTDVDSTLKIGKENKDQQEQKKKTVKNEWSWRPFANDLALSVLKSTLAGFSFKLGGSLYDYSFKRQVNSASLTVIPGGRGSNNIAV